MKLKNRIITYEFGDITEVIAIDMGDKVCWVEKEKYEKDPSIKLHLEKIKKIMENKYYTPELGEFHIGFEFEYNNNAKSEKKKEPRWIKHTVDMFDNQTYESGEYNEYAYEYIGMENCRVKYLDASDIEELGWTDYEPPFEYNHKWKLGEWELNAWFNGEMPSVRIQEYPIFFQGIIKNKSELKKLMKQLGI
jgi:hypothetical protein